MSFFSISFDNPIIKSTMGFFGQAAQATTQLTSSLFDPLGSEAQSLQNRLEPISPRLLTPESLVEGYNEEFRGYFFGKPMPHEMRVDNKAADAVLEELAAAGGKEAFLDCLEASLQTQTARFQYGKLEQLTDLVGNGKDFSIHSWKIPLAKMFWETPRDSLPSFIQGKWDVLAQGLPKSHDPEAGLVGSIFHQSSHSLYSSINRWTEASAGKGGPDAILRMKEKVQEACDGGIRASNLVEWCREYSSKQYYSVAASVSEQLFRKAHGNTEDFSDQMRGFTQSSTELLIVKDLWAKYKKTISEAAFQEAHKAWDKMGMSPEDLEKEIKKRI